MQIRNNIKVWDSIKNFKELVFVEKPESTFFTLGFTMV